MSRSCRISLQTERIFKATKLDVPTDDKETRRYLPILPANRNIKLKEIVNLMKYTSILNLPECKTFAIAPVLVGALCSVNLVVQKIGITPCIPSFHKSALPDTSNILRKKMDDFRVYFHKSYTVIAIGAACLSLCNLLVLKDIPW